MELSIDTLNDEQLFKLQAYLQKQIKKKEEDKLESLYKGKTVETFLRELQLSKGGIIKEINVTEKEKNEEDKKEILKNYEYIIENKVKIDFESSLFLSLFSSLFPSLSCSNVSSKVIVKGSIQSGKTEYMIAVMFYIILVYKKSVSIIVRNYTQDRVQLVKRINEFKEKYGRIYKEFYEIGVIEDVLKIKNVLNTTPYIYVLLNNEKNISHINRLSILNDIDYFVIFDEADLTDSASDEDDIKREKSKDIEILKKRSLQTIWVSGTVIDKLVKEEGIMKGDVIILKTPENYKAIINGFIKMVKVPGFYVSNHTKNVFEMNPDIHTFLEDYSKKPVFEEYNHPRICLFTVTNIQGVMSTFQNDIEELFPGVFTTIVYNGEGTIVRKRNTVTQKKIGISETLQKLKNDYTYDNTHENKHTHIIIISGLMASRGISFVSDDYKWHLTDQYSLVSDKTNEADILQKIRLHGVYNDDIPLILYTNIVDDIQKALLKSEEMILRFKEDDLKSEHIEYDSKTFLNSVPISDDKFSKRSITRTAIIKPNKVVGDDGGWSVNVYDRKEVIPEELYKIYGMNVSEEQKKKNIKKIVIDDSDDERGDEMGDENDKKKSSKDQEKLYEDNKEEDDKEDKRLFKMFKKWMNDNNTKISLFLKEFDPDKMYKETEIKSLCKSKNIVLRHLMVDKYEKSSGYGKIIENKIMENNKSFYRMRSSLVTEFKKNFKK